MKFKLIPTIIVSLSLCILMSFGFWQLQRLNLKQKLITHINQKIKKEAIALPKNFLPSQNGSYTKYKLHGQFVEDKNMFLYGSNFATPSKAGYFILTPFLTDDGQYILVNRGWAESKNIDLKNEKEEIIVMLMLPQKPGFATPKNDLVKNIWLSIDLAEAASYTKLDLTQDFYLTVIEGNDGLLLPAPKEFTKLRNHHLEYAITWFSLGLALLIVVYYKCRRPF